MNKDILKNLPKLDMAILSAMRREILGVLILVAFAFFFYKFGYQANKARLDAVRAQNAVIMAEITRLDAEIQQTRKLSGAVEEAELSLKRLEYGLKRLRERLPSDRQISRLLSKITAGDSKTGVRVVSVKPMPPEDRGELVRLPFQLGLEARFFDLGGYIEMIEGLERIVVVDNFMMEPLEEGSATLGIRMFLSAYMLGTAGENGATAKTR